MLGTGGQSSLWGWTSTSTGKGGLPGDKSKNRTRVSQVRAALCVLGAVAVAACSSAPQEKAKFSPKKYGVKASPKMVASGKPVPKGGGRYVVGKKYKIAGKWYYPKEDPNYRKTGLASWYGPTFHGRKTANGEIFDRYALTAAHTTMPLPSYARVTNTENGRSMIVRVNDRGPFHGNRIIDLSERVATMLGTKSSGVGTVKVEYVGKAPLHGQDEAYLMASYRGPGAVEPGASRPGTLLAQAQPPVFFGDVPPPAPRPYVMAPVQTAFAGQVPVGSVNSFDPAIAFEAGKSNVRLASANGFEQAVPAYAPTSSLDVPTPATPTFVTGSAVSSFAANDRISSAHAMLATIGSGSVSLRTLASASE